MSTTGSRILAAILRIGEIASAAVVAGVIGTYLQNFDSSNGANPFPRFIYSEVIAGTSILFGFLFLLPFSLLFYLWPVDLILGLAWFAVFGVLVSFPETTDCRDRIFFWDGFYRWDVCYRWRAAEAFAFISGVLWLMTTFIAIYIARRNRK